MKLLPIAFGTIVVVAAGLAGLYGSGALLDGFMAEGQATTGDQGRDAPARVEVAPSNRETVNRTAEAVGSTEAIQSIDVQAMAAGRVVEIAFDEGTEVEAGQQLIQLDDRAEQAALKEAEASLNEARGNLQRARSLAEQNIQSNATLEATEALVLRAEAVRDQAINAVQDRTVTAAFPGRIGLSGVDIGQMVTTTTVLTALDDLSQVEVTFSLPEAYFGNVEQGQSVIANSDAYGDRRFQGTVSAIDTRIDDASRSFAVRATIPNDDRALATGMFMGVSIVLEERRSVTVPEVAVVNEGDKAYVFTVENDTAKRRDVTIGLRQNGRVEISDGLDEGVPVVVSGLQSISDGDKVEVVNAAAPEEPEAVVAATPPGQPEPSAPASAPVKRPLG